MAWNTNLTNLNDVLADLYPFPENSRRIVSAAEIRPAFIDFNGRMIDVWHGILVEADKRGKVPDLVRSARKDYPDDQFLKLAEGGQLLSVRGPSFHDDLEWNNQIPNDKLEKIIGQQNTLLPINFLEIGLERARSVARVKLSNGDMGSGFLTSDNLFVTNHHVLPDKEHARQAVIQFNYQQSSTDLALQSEDFHLDPDAEAGFATSPLYEDDWTVVRVQGDANSSWGMIEMKPIELQLTEYVNIVQHPGGGPKQIALYHNTVVGINDQRVWYLTDTLPGSSGSPAFDSEWRLVAVHHSGGLSRETATQEPMLRNEGININCVLKGLAESGIQV